MRELLRRIHYLLHRRRFDRELADEMQTHREIAESNRHHDFGNSLRLREESRDAWGWTWIDRLLQDLHFSVRVMMRSPGFTLVAVLILAIGIGVNVAAFGFVNLVMFKPLPVREPDTLLRLHRQAPQNYASDMPYRMMDFYREHSKTLSALLTLDFGQVRIDDSSDNFRAFFVTSNFFTDLGANVAFGRLFHPTMDEKATGDPAVLLSHEFWQRHFGGDPSIVGKPIRLNGKNATIVGVVAEDFSGLTFSSPEIWLPLSTQPYFVEGSKLLTNLSGESDGVDVWGRMKPGISANMVEDELRSLAGQLRLQYPNDVWEKESILTRPGGYAQNAGGRTRSTDVPRSLQAQMAPIIALVSTLALLILAVTCSNLGSLLLARGVTRQREIQIRAAVGAGTSRLLRQLLTESLVLGALGMAAGLAVGSVVLQSLLMWSGGPKWMRLTPDWRVIAFAFGVGLLAAVLFGFTPAMQVARQRHRASRTRQFLIGTQVAASCVLLIVAGLLVRSLNHGIALNPGFDYEHTVLVDPGLARYGYSGSTARAYLDDLQARLRSIPGVESVSLSATPPLGNRAKTTSVEKNGDTLEVYVNPIEPAFFRTMQIPLLRGRNLHGSTDNGVVVSESLARRLWPGEDPLTQYFEMGPDKLPVVGVAGSARGLALNNPDAVEIYTAINESELVETAILVRIPGSVDAVLPSAGSVAKSLDPNVTPSIRPLKAAFERKLDGTHKSALAVSVLGFTALFLACMGIVGAVAYTVSQRTKEIGIRMALGAKGIQILTVVLRQLTMPVSIGLVAGIGGAAGLSQLLRGELYGLSGLDPVAYLAAVMVFALTASCAALVQARKALRVDPIGALRQD